jgi:hypothetical protein
MEHRLVFAWRILGEHPTEIGRESNAKVTGFWNAGIRSFPRHSSFLDSQIRRSQPTVYRFQLTAGHARRYTRS